MTLRVHGKRFGKWCCSALVLAAGAAAVACQGGSDDSSTEAAPQAVDHVPEPRVAPARVTSGAAVRSIARQVGGLASASVQRGLSPASNEVVVQLHPQAGRSVGGVAPLLSSKLKRAARSIRSAPRPRHTTGVARPELVTIDVDPSAGKSVDDVVRELRQLPEVQFAEPNYRYETFATPNDPGYGAQAQFEPIRAPQAWDVTTGSSSVVVAVLDTGIEWTHPDLAANIWQNSGEIAGDGVDNDANGFVDDVRGYDFVSATTNVASDEDPGPPDNDPNDVQGHGTHVAGIVGAVGNNGTDVTGVAWTVRLMPLRVGYKTPSGLGELLLSDIANALHYAADEGAHVVSMSFGGPQPSQILADALRYAADHGVLLVAAAGNSGNSYVQYPAAYDRVLSVAATQGSSLAGFSSFGPWVDIAAPGVDILSTHVGASTIFMSGTSMACPVVSGAAALVRASHPTWNAQQIAEKLTSTASATASNWQKSFGSGLLDVSAAVTAPAALATFDTVRAHFEEVTGDGDGHLEPNESGRAHVTVKGYGPEANAVVALTTSQSGVSVSGSPVTLSQVGFSRLATAAFNFTLPSSLPLTQAVTFDVTITSGSRTFADTVTLDPPPRWAPERILADRYPFAHSITGLPNGSVAVVAALDGVPPVLDSVFGIVKNPSGQWGPLTQLSGDAYANNPTACVGADGGLDVVFERQAGPNNFQIYFRRYDAATSSWGSEEQVTTNAVLIGTSQDVRTSYAVARDTSGRTHVAWVDSGSFPRPLRYTSRTGTGAWSAPTTIATFPEADLLQANLEMLALPDGSRRLFVERFAPSLAGSSIEVVLSGTGTTWQAPVNVPVLFDNEPTFLQGSNIFRIAKRTHWSDPVELVRWNGSTWLTDRVITPNITGSWYTMSSVAAAAMGSSTGFGVLVQDAFLEGPFAYHSGVAGALTSLRATARPQLNAHNPALWLSGSDVPHAAFAQYVQPDGFFIQAGQLTYQSNVADPGMILPAKPAVTASVTSQSLNASWTVANPSQVAKYLFAIGTAPGLDDLSRWAATTSTSLAHFFGDRPPLAGETFYVSVRAVSTTGHSGVIGFSPGVGLTQCTPETDATFCTRLGKNCGTVSGTDNCGQSRTVSSCGSCTAPQSCGGGGTPNVCGGGGGTACSDLCSGPTIFTGPNYQSGNLGTNATCHQTSANLSGANCGNFASGRTFRVNDVQVTCSGGNISLPAKRNGGYCFQASSGNHPWAYFTTW